MVLGNTFHAGKHLNNYQNICLFNCFLSEDAFSDELVVMSSIKGSQLSGRKDALYSFFKYVCEPVVPSQTKRK